MTELERQVMDFILSGDHAMLEALRRQLSVATIASRELTGVGFFTNFSVANVESRLEPPISVVIGDVHTEVTGLEHGAGFLLFVEDGLLDFLECWIVEDAWPTNAELRRLFYMRPGSDTSNSLVETVERDFAYAIRPSSTPATSNASPKTPACPSS